MPIGSSKIGVLGAGLVPGGSVTFNASGTWDVPPGVKKVSITGKGGTGNPGNAGNQGNPGNFGTGGAGGLGGASISFPQPTPAVNAGGQGGNAWKSFIGNILTTGPNPPTAPNTETRSSPQGPTFAAFGGQFCPSNQLGLLQGNPFNPNPFTSQSGLSGNAGTAGNPGNPGNPGQDSSGLGNTFPGGAGGNAGAGGAAGNGGSGGAGGGCGNNGPSPLNAGGSGGTGAGSGGTGTNQINTVPDPSCSARYLGGGGGGGAGAVNSGASGYNNRILPSGPTQGNNCACIRSAAGGTGNIVSNSLPTDPTVNRFPSIGPTTFAGHGGTFQSNFLAGAHTVNLPVFNCGNTAVPRNSPKPTANYARASINNINPANPNPLQTPEIFRSGAGGGMGGAVFNVPGANQRSLGSGGGGGGRGSAGNPGGPTPTPTGAAGTLQTFNCVPVTPGAPTPITVGTPGGQIVISWNPQ